MINKQYKATILKGGQITIPAAIRRQLGLKPGQKVHQYIQSGKVFLDFDLQNRSVEQNQDPKRKD